MFIDFEPNRSASELELDMDSLQVALEKRLRARAARADNAVQITADTLHRWVQEEFETLVGERLLAHELAVERNVN